MTITSHPGGPRQGEADERACPAVLWSRSRCRVSVRVGPAVAEWRYRFRPWGPYKCWTPRGRRGVLVGRGWEEVMGGLPVFLETESRFAALTGFLLWLAVMGPMPCWTVFLELSRVPKPSHMGGPRVGGAGSIRKRMGRGNGRVTSVHVLRVATWSNGILTGWCEQGLAAT